VIAELNRLGIMVDLSHPAQTTNKEAIELSKAPVIASHSSARALNDVSRNLYDEELQAIKENGGVVQAVAFASYLNSDKHAAHQKAAKKIIDSMAQDKGFKQLNWNQIRNLDEEKAAEYVTARREFMK